MFSFTVNKNEIIMTESETITSGSVNAYECKFDFSEDWAGLSKTVTFRAGYVKISVILDSTNTCSIPWEVLEKDAVQIYCGVRGTVTAYDEEEDAIIPTVYCLLGTIRKGTELGDNAAPPEPSVVDQIMSRIEALDADKQDKLTGTAGQVVGFDANGNAVAQDNKSPEYEAGENISITGGTISAKNSTYSIKKIDTTEPGIAAAYNLINTDEEGTSVGDVIKIPEEYDDTGIRATLEIVSEKVDENTDAIASNTSLISANTTEISKMATAVSNLSTTVSGIETNVSLNTDNISALSTTVSGIETNVSRNTDNISALSTTVSGIETNVSRNTDNISSLSDSVAVAGNAIKKNAADIASVSGNVSELSDSVAAAGNAIKKNAADIASVSGKIDTVETNVSNLSSSKQDKITGKEGQIVGFNANGEPVAQDGGSGEPGKDGVTFVPMVSESGIISWTNDGGRENPKAVNIMGPKGDKGDPGDPASVPAYSTTATAGSATAGIVDTTYRLTKDGTAVGAYMSTKKSGVHVDDGQGYMKNTIPYGAAVTVSTVSSGTITASLGSGIIFEEYYADQDYISSYGYCVTNFSAFSESVGTPITINMKGSASGDFEISYIDIPLSITLKTNTQRSVRKLFKMSFPSSYFTVRIGNTTSTVSLTDVYFDAFIVNDSNSNQVLRLFPFLPYGGYLRIKLSSSSKYGFKLMPMS